MGNSLSQLTHCVDLVITQRCISLFFSSHDSLNINVWKLPWRKHRLRYNYWCNQDVNTMVTLSDCSMLLINTLVTIMHRSKSQPHPTPLLGGSNQNISASVHCWSFLNACTLSNFSLHYLITLKFLALLKYLVPEDIQTPPQWVFRFQFQFQFGFIHSAKNLSLKDPLPCTTTQP